MGGAGTNSAQCHQQLPILGMKHTGAQELGYTVEREVAGHSFLGLEVGNQVRVRESG